MHHAVKDYLKYQPQLSLTYKVRRTEGEILGAPISFNPFTDEVRYSDNATETVEQVIVTGFRYEGRGFAISGNIKPTVLQQETRINGDLDDCYYDNGKVCDAIYAAIGPCNRDLVDII